MLGKPSHGGAYERMCWGNLNMEVHMRGCVGETFTWRCICEDVLGKPSHGGAYERMCWGNLHMEVHMRGCVGETFTWRCT